MAMLNNQMVHVDKSSGTMEHMGWKLTSFNTSKNEEYIYIWKCLVNGMVYEMKFTTWLAFHFIMIHNLKIPFFLRPAMGKIPPETFTTGVTVLTTSGQYNS